MDQTTLFLETSNELRRVFDKGFVSLHLQAGEVVCEQGEHDDRLFILEAGLLEVCVFSVEGRKLSLNLLRPRSVFGEIALFDPGPRTARIEATEASHVRYIRQSSLMEAVKVQPHLAAELLSLAGKRLRWLARQVEEQAFLAPTARLAAKTLFLAGEGGKIAMSQSQLADYVGITREMVSKTLAEWRREEIVSVSRGLIEVLDKDALSSKLDI
ncbi:Crp/Fnr family transcriptional regulator [Tateyamaria pelophila]|uniref:Crp/Fnr family transcriptional regulator n=1 Tax=Tateyamaria pelophila TaxID=328415 RepID=UPI001CBFD8B9|nr:Crp/Fnr family transcriptional regulator [Tateyamaria pelophila]